MKNSNETIGNRTRDLPACSAESQSTAPPRVPRYRMKRCGKQKDSEKSGTKGTTVKEVVKNMNLK